MALPDVTRANPHVAAHNDERHLINSLQNVNDSTFVAALNPVTTTTALVAINDAINTTYKVEGKSVFNSTTGKPVWASGSTAGAVWKDATGAVAHTPA